MRLKHNTRSTSIAAAIANLPIRNLQQRKILAFLGSKKRGATRDEIELETGLSGNAVRPRTLELIELGHIRETAKVRKTRAGRDAYVLEVCQ